jgi:hypothetical protein
MALSLGADGRFVTRHDDSVTPHADFADGTPDFADGTPDFADGAPDSVTAPPISVMAPPISVRSGRTDDSSRRQHSLIPTGQMTDELRAGRLGGWRASGLVSPFAGLVDRYLQLDVPALGEAEHGEEDKECLDGDQENGEGAESVGS